MTDNMRSLKTVHKIPNTNIVIDYWKSSENEDKFAIRFMTILRLKDYQAEYMRGNNYKIYTSSNNKELLEYYKIPTDRIVAIEPGSYMEISDEHAGYSFRVSTIESNYCAGSCMFLFQGPFGKILYTGFFRPAKSCDPLQDPILKNVIQRKLLDEVYIDNTYAAEHCQFPSRADVIQEAVYIIKENPNHKIIIAGNRFGKEEVLRDIAMSLEEKIGVSKSKYEELVYTMAPQTLKKFIPSPDECRITVEDEQLTLKQCKRKQSEAGLCIVILLTAQYLCEEKVRGTPVPRLSNLHILPYSSHASYRELMHFLYHLEARTIKPIILTESENTKIPQKMMEMCRLNEDSVPLQDSDFCFDTCCDIATGNGNRTDCETTTPIPEICRQNNPNHTYTVNDVTPTKITLERNNNELRDSDASSNVDSESTYRDCEESNDVDAEIYHESESVAFISLLETQDEYIDEESSDLASSIDPLSRISVVNDSLEIGSNLAPTELATESTAEGTQESDISFVPDSNEVNASFPTAINLASCSNPHRTVESSGMVTEVSNLNKNKSQTLVREETHSDEISSDNIIRSEGGSKESENSYSLLVDESISEEDKKVWKILHHYWLVTEEEDVKRTMLTKDTWNDLGLEELDLF